MQKIALVGAGFIKIKQMIDNGDVGQVAVVRTSRSGTYSSDIFFDVMIHDFGWLKWCFGGVERVYAKRVNNYALVTLRFKNGVLAHCEGHQKSSCGFSCQVEVAGSDGLIAFSDSDIISLNIETKTSDEKTSVILDGIEALKIAEAAIKSIDIGQPVNIPQYKGMQ